MNHFLKDVHIEQVKYEADYYSWLNDGIKNEGSRLEGHDFTLTLDDFYDITKLKVVIYHRNEVDSRTYLFIEYVSAILKG